MNRLVPIFGALGIALALPALAQTEVQPGWRDGVSVFRVGIAAGSEVADASAAAEPFRLALEEALGVPVEIFAARDYTALVDAHVDSRIEYSVLSATAYAAAWNLCECVEPIAIASNADGATGFRSVVITRADGPSTIERMRGRKLAVLDPGTVGGALLALRELEDQGLLSGGSPIAIEHFSDSGAAIEALRAGLVDGYLGWTPAVDERSTRAGRGTLHLLDGTTGGDAGFRIVWRSSEIPLRVHAVRNNLPAQAKTILRTLLSGLFGNDPVAYDAIEPVHGGGFVPARQAQFAGLAQALAKIGIEARRPDRSESPNAAGPSADH